MLLPFEKIIPSVNPDNNFIAPSSVLIGKVTLHANASIWFNAVLRADNDEIVIGENSNIQDGSVLHVDKGSPVKIGTNVTVGHAAIVHACSIGDDCLIGMGSTILSRANIGIESIVGAGALVTEDKSFPPRSLILGAPAKLIREVTEEEINAIRLNALHYVNLSKKYIKDLESSLSN